MGDATAGWVLKRARSLSVSWCSMRSVRGRVQLCNGCLAAIPRKVSQESSTACVTPCNCPFFLNFVRCHDGHSSIFDFRRGRSIQQLAGFPQGHGTSRCCGAACDLSVDECSCVMEV